MRLQTAIDMSIRECPNCTERIEVEDLHSDLEFHCEYCDALVCVQFESYTGQELVGNPYAAQLVLVED